MAHLDFKFILMLLASAVAHYITQWPCGDRGRCGGLTFSALVSSSGWGQCALGHDTHSAFLNPGVQISTSELTAGGTDQYPK